MQLLKNSLKENDFSLILFFFNRQSQLIEYIDYSSPVNVLQKTANDFLDVINKTENVVVFCINMDYCLRFLKLKLNNSNAVSEEDIELDKTKNNNIPNIFKSHVYYGDFITLVDGFKRADGYRIDAILQGYDKSELLSLFNLSKVKNVYNTIKSVVAFINYLGLNTKVLDINVLMNEFINTKDILLDVEQDLQAVMKNNPIEIDNPKLGFLGLKDSSKGGVVWGKKDIQITNETFNIVNIDFKNFYPSIYLNKNNNILKEHIHTLLQELYLYRLDKSSSKEEKSVIKKMLNFLYGKISVKENNKSGLANYITYLGRKTIVELLSFLYNSMNDYYVDLINIHTDGLVLATDAPCSKITSYLEDFLNKKTTFNISYSFIKQLYQKNVNTKIIVYDNDVVEIKGNWQNKKASENIDCYIYNYKEYISSFYLGTKTPIPIILRRNKDIFERVYIKENSFHCIYDFLELKNTPDNKYYTTDKNDSVDNAILNYQLQKTWFKSFELLNKGMTDSNIPEPYRTGEQYKSYFISKGKKYMINNRYYSYKDAVEQCNNLNTEQADTNIRYQVKLDLSKTGNVCCVDIDLKSKDFKERNELIIELQNLTTEFKDIPFLLDYDKYPTDRWGIHIFTNMSIANNNKIITSGINVRSVVENIVLNYPNLVKKVEFFNKTPVTLYDNSNLVKDDWDLLLSKAYVKKKLPQGRFFSNEQIKSAIECIGKVTNTDLGLTLSGSFIVGKCPDYTHTKANNPLYISNFNQNWFVRCWACSLDEEANSPIKKAIENKLNEDNILDASSGIDTQVPENVVVWDKRGVGGGKTTNLIKNVLSLLNKNIHCVVICNNHHIFRNMQEALVKQCSTLGIKIPKYWHICSGGDAGLFLNDHDINVKLIFVQSVYFELKDVIKDPKRTYLSEEDSYHGYSKKIVDTIIDRKYSLFIDEADIVANKIFSYTTPVMLGTIIGESYSTYNTFEPLIKTMILDETRYSSIRMIDPIRSEPHKAMLDKGVFWDLDSLHRMVAVYNESYIKDATPIEFNSDVLFLKKHENSYDYQVYSLVKKDGSGFVYYLHHIVSSFKEAPYIYLSSATSTTGLDVFVTMLQESGKDLEVIEEDVPIPNHGHLYVCNIKSKKSATKILTDPIHNIGQKNISILEYLKTSRGVWIKGCKDTARDMLNKKEAAIYCEMVDNEVVRKGVKGNVSFEKVNKNIDITYIMHGSLRGSNDYKDHDVFIVDAPRYKINISFYSFFDLDQIFKKVEQGNLNTLIEEEAILNTAYHKQAIGRACRGQNNKLILIFNYDNIEGFIPKNNTTLLELDHNKKDNNINNEEFLFNIVKTWVDEFSS